ncbi:MAG: hypothetical protein KME50_00955 [Nostoc desertorum CM1-VF14]|jgi:hypothetical protein|nr:hypothetical protein [Nostoc desertorum CM1-VF14]
MKNQKINVDLRPEEDDILEQYRRETGKTEEEVTQELIRRLNMLLEGWELYNNGEGKQPT